MCIRRFDIARVDEALIIFQSFFPLHSSDEVVIAVFQGLGNWLAPR